MSECFNLYLDEMLCDEVDAKGLFKRDGTYVEVLVEQNASSLLQTPYRYKKQREWRH